MGGDSPGARIKVLMFATYAVSRSLPVELAAMPDAMLTQLVRAPSTLRAVNTGYPGLASETWDPTSSPQPSLASRHDFSRAENATLPHKPVILSEAKRSRKIRGCSSPPSASQSTSGRPGLDSETWDPTNSLHPHLVSGHDFSRANNAASSDAGFSPCVPTLGDFRSAGYSSVAAKTPAFCPSHSSACTIRLSISALSP